MSLEKDSYERIIENLHDGLYLVDHSRTIMYWNKAAEEMTGYLYSEVVGTVCPDNKLNRVDSKGKSYCDNDCPLIKTLTDGEITELKMFISHKEGYRIPIFVKVLPYKNEVGDLIGAVKIFSEKTEVGELGNP